jgi:hypothetical protein
LLASRIYGAGGGKGCTFQPGVVFRFWPKRGSPFDAYICFSCYDVGVVRGDTLRTHDVTAGRLDLLEIASDAFPDDGELKHLTAIYKQSWRPLQPPPK